MRIYTKSGDLALRTFNFPDGQPHLVLETYDIDFREITVEVALKSSVDLFNLLLVSSVLRTHGYSQVNLNCRYLLGARMDRAIDSTQPFTLEVVARLINSCGFSKVRILDVHSDVALRLIRNSDNIRPLRCAQQAITASGATVIVAPDKGGAHRAQMVWGAGQNGTIIYCTKERDPQTGALSGFRVHDYEPEKDGTSCIIVDDICDGGNTFVGLAKELRKAGAKKVFLYVTHSIFSKGIPLEGIDHIYTTDSFIHREMLSFPDKQKREVTIISISMKDLL